MTVVSNSLILGRLMTKILTLLAPRILVPTPITGGGGGRNGHPKYLKNNKCYKPETLRGVRGILQGLKKFQFDITAFAW